MATKVENIPNVTLTTKPFGLHIEVGQIKTVFQTASDLPNEPSDTYQYLYTGTDFTQLLAKDVGTLMGGPPVGITLLKLAQDLAVGIAVDRGDENAGDWT